MLTGRFCRGMDDLSAVCAYVSWLDDRVDVPFRGCFVRRGMRWRYIDLRRKFPHDSSKNSFLSVVDAPDCVLFIESKK
jgi:hypothetical protein